MEKKEYSELALQIGQAIAAGMSVSIKPGFNETISMVVSEKDQFLESSIPIENCQHNMKPALGQLIIDFLSL